MTTHKPKREGFGLDCKMELGSRLAYLQITAPKYMMGYPKTGPDT